MKHGLYANIHAKQERIKKGSGERMRKAGEKGKGALRKDKCSSQTRGETS